MELHTINHCLPLLLILLAVEANETSYNVTESVREPRGSRRVVKQYSGSRPDPIVCTDEGFRADPNNCAVFYRCMKSGRGKFTSFKFQCAPGTVYDPDSEVCNHPRNTKRSRCGGEVTSLNEELYENEVEVVRPELPSPITTRKSVYTETPRLPTRYSWVTKRNEAVSTTTTPWITSSKKQNTATTSIMKLPWPKSTKVTTPIPFLASTKKQRSTTTKYSVTRKQSSQIGDLCTSEGFMGDSENCHKFYRCVGNQRGGFVRYEFLCSDTTIWDEDIQSCNHAWAVRRRRCGRGSLNDIIPIQKENYEISSERATNGEATTPTTIQEQLQINYGSRVSQSQTQIASGLVKQNQTQININNRNDSNSYNFKQNQTQISHGSAISQTQTQINYGDTGMQTQLQIDHSNESSQSQSQIHELSTKRSTTAQENDYDNNLHTTGDISTTECTKNGFMRDRNDCKKFYRCVDNGRGSYTRYDFSCGEGTVWDSKLETCNHAWAVNDCKGEGSSAYSTVSTGKTTDAPSITVTATKPTQNIVSSTQTMATDENEDDGYSNPIQNEIATSTTTKSTTLTSTIMSTSAPPSTKPTNSNNSCKTSGFMGDENDCKKFYRCVDNGNGGYTRYEFSCGEGTVWDSRIEACNHAWAVEKCGGNFMSNVENAKTTTAKETVITTVRTTTKSQITSSESVSNDEYDNGYGLQDEVPSSSVLVSSTTISSTSKQPQTQTTGNSCTFDGFMGDNDDCKKFYRCVDNGNGGFIRHEFMCGEGTVWDKKINACNHAWAVEKCGGPSTTGNKEEMTTLQYTTTTSSEIPLVNQDIDTEYGQQSQTSSTSSTTENLLQINLEPDENKCKNSGFMADSKNCKKFYRCVDNGNDSYTRYEFTCGEGTVWDPKIEACNHDWAVESCGRNSNDVHEQEMSSQQPADSSTQPTSHADNDFDGEQQQPTSSTQVSENKNNECESVGFRGDKNDCKKFYRCVDNGNGGFTRYEFTCGDGTVWNQDIQTCDHDSPNRSCGSNNLYKEPDEKEPERQQDEMYTENTTKDSVSSYGSTEVIQSSPRPASAICKSEGFYGNPEDCRKFYRCVDNGQGGFTKYDFTCGDGTIWDQEIQACNHESSNKCAISFVDGNTEGSFSSTTSSSTTAYTEQQHSNETNHVSGNDECTSEGFFANSNDCKKFHRCVSNDKGGYIKYEFACAEGTVWVQDIQSCDYEDDNMNCSRNISTSKPQSSEHQQTTEGSQSQTSTTSNMPLEKPDKQSDEYPDKNSTSESENCSSEGFYPNPKDCKKFYRCVDNGQGAYTKYDFTCGEGTAWDTEIQTCNHISEVKGCQNAIQENNENKPLQDEVPQTTDSSSTTKTTTTESNKPSNKDICEKEGYFGNTQDCKKFYRCVDNGKGGYTKYDYDCGEGTIWDQDVVTCNHPQDVNNPSCKDSDSSTSAPPNTSTMSSSATSSSSESQTSTSTTENSSQSSTNCSQENSSTKPEKEDIKCEKAGYYPNPNDCKKFYRCVDWDGDEQRFSVYHFDCGDGTIWDPQLETCNHEESVYPPRDCSGSQPQSENIHEPSTTSKEDSTTTTESSTLQSTTSEQSTTQQSTSSEETSTHQSTTSEKPTTQETSSEQTTTEQSTTPATSQTTTQQSTTTERTTTQQSSTTDSTTTQQTSTTEKTTTQQSTTIDSTTAQQTTITEGTTTQQSTTTDSTTSQYTTTTESTTTEQSTTSESTITEQSTTTQGITTQQSATMTQTSTTTDQSTTQDSTTEQTTQETTNTDETTTQQSMTTQESTTEITESTNESSMTEESSTEQQTTTEELSNNQSTTEGSTTQSTDDSSTTETGEDTATEASSTSSKECPDTEDDQYLYVCPTSFKRHPKYCNMFYQCTEDNDSHEINIAVFTCPNNTIYDESQTQCVEEDKADKKCDGEIAQKRRVKRLNVNYKEPIVVGKQKHSCSAIGYFPFEEGTECSSVFMKCQIANTGKLRGYVHRCPEGFEYWSISKRCEKKENLKDCRRSGNDWSRRWEIPVERKNVAIRK